MPSQTEKRSVPYLADQMFALVLDVSSYPEFLPWAQKASVYNIEGFNFDADLTVGIGAMAQTYSSHVTADPQERMITATYIKGPFKYLNNKWTFTPTGTIESPSTMIEFFLDFEIDNLLLKPFLQPFLTQATTVMIEAFEKRAAQKYN